MGGCHCGAEGNLSAIPLCVFSHLQHICRPAGRWADVIVGQRALSPQFPCCLLFRTYMFAGQVADGRVSLSGRRHYLSDSFVHWFAASTCLQVRWPTARCRCGADRLRLQSLPGSFVAWFLAFTSLHECLQARWPMGGCNCKSEGNLSPVPLLFAFSHLHACRPCGRWTDVITGQRPSSPKLPCCCCFCVCTLASQVADGRVSLWGRAGGRRADCHWGGGILGCNSETHRVCMRHTATHMISYAILDKQLLSASEICANRIILRRRFGMPNKRPLSDNITPVDLCNVSPAVAVCFRERMANVQ